MDTTFILFAVLLFAAVVLLVWGVATAWSAHRNPEAERIARRLRGVMGTEVRQDDVTIVKARRLSDNPEFDAMLRGVPAMHRLDRMLLQAGSDWLVAKLLLVCLVCMIAGAIAALLFGARGVAILPFAVGLASLPLLQLGRAREARMTRFERQLPEALDMMGRAMRAGHAFPTALKLVADEVAAPLGEEFKTAFDEVNFGVSMADALNNLAQRVPSMDLQYFVVAVLIQRESGGNLTELLTSISTIVRDRHKLAGQVRVLSAEGRISAWVLCLLPFGAGMSMYVANPETMGVLVYDPVGRQLSGAALGMMLFGVLAIRKIVRIRM